jgi:PKD repeat protein
MMLRLQQRALKAGLLILEMAKTQTFNAAPFKHTYTDTGIFIVKLTVTDNTDCIDTYISTDTISISKPVPGFKADFTTICPKTAITFADTSAGEGLHYYWDFGDGYTSILPSPVHQYTATGGNFTVKLVLTDTTGCMDSVTSVNYIKVQAPKPAFEARDTSTICQLLETKFTFKGTDYQSYFWDFGDGSTSTLQNPKHFYNTYGTYEAKLYLVGYGGCLDSTSDTIHVYDPYSITNIGYTAAPSCNPFWVNFTLLTPPSTDYTFYFGDGGADSSLITSFQHYYKDPGSYAPYVLLQDSTGCQVTVGGPTNISIIGAVPYFGADKKAFCDTGMVFFTDYTLPRSAIIVTRNWDFGDGAVSSNPNPSHQFIGPGTYVVAQTVTDDQNCTNTITDTIRIYSTPNPVIAGDTVVCLNNTLLLQGNLMVPDTSITWKWNLGGNGQATSQNVSVKYSQPGTYLISLEATNKLGCKGDTSKSILAPPAPVITVNGNPTIALGTGINLPVSYSPETATYVWTPASGLSCADCPVPFANPKFNTKYNVKVTDIYGCSADQDITITVVCNGKNYFVPNTFSPNGDGRK